VEIVDGLIERYTGYIGLGDLEAKGNNNQDLLRTL